MSKSWKIVLIALGIVAIIGIGIAGAGYYVVKYPQFHPQETVYLYIDEDDNLDSITKQIKHIGNPNRMEGFEWLAQYKKYGERIKTGRYAVKPGDSAYGLYSRLASGRQTPINLTIGSTRTLDRLARSVATQLMIDSAAIASRIFDAAYVEKLGYDEATIYTLFIPNTYQVYWNMSVDDFFERIQKEHNRFWNEERRRKAQAIGMSPIEVTTLASIVDEETNSNAEKPIVAGLYINRLHKGMPLQADPTVKFANKNFEARRVTNAMLAADSPYNTYKYNGLPPGPIRIASIQAIDGVLNRTKHNYLYMCAKEDFSGLHNFAATLAEHNTNARKYHRALNERGIFK